MKKLVIFLTALFLFIPTTKAASGSAYITGSSSAKAGATVTLQLGFNGSDKVAGVEYTIEATNLEIVSINGVNNATVSRNGNKVIQAIFATQGLDSGKVWASIVVKVPSSAKAGSTGTITIKNIGMSLDNNPNTIYPSTVSKTITVAKTTTEQKPVVTQPKSSDATLKALSTTEATIAFDKNTFDYDITVDYEVTKLSLTATANDASATVLVTGNENFVVGRNYVTITVTAEDGTKKTYNLKVTRSPEEVKEVECPVCEVKEEKKDNEKLVWIIVSITLLVILLLETGYIIYDKKIKD